MRDNAIGASLETAAPTATTPAAGVGPKPWGIPAILAGLTLPVLLWASSLALSIAEDSPEELTTGEVVTGVVLTVLILDGIFIAFPAALCFWRYRLGWSALGLRPVDFSFWWVPPVGAVGAHVGVRVYAVILTLVGAEDAVRQDVEELFDSRVVLPLVGVATVLMAPFAEELFFRGFVFAGLLRPLGLGWALAASGLLFGAFHVTGPESVGLVPPLAAIGALLAWIYYRTGSLWPSIGTHLLFNLVSFAFLASFAGGGS